MPFDLHRYTATRPQLFHLTNRLNLPRITRDGQLQPTSRLIGSSLDPDRAMLPTERRREHRLIPMPDGGHVHLRDQGPFHRGNIAFEPGWDFERTVALLNQRVYFWPGKGGMPNVYGRRHFEKYHATGEDCVILIALAAAAIRSAEAPPEFARCNSGSPRCNPRVPGHKAPRGSKTFRVAEEFDGGIGDVVEVTFPGAVPVPFDSIEVVPIGAFLARAG